MKKLNRRKLKKLSMGYQMVALAELYNQKPDDPTFEKYDTKAMKGIKLLAAALQRAKERGELTDESRG